VIADPARPRGSTLRIDGSRYIFEHRPLFEDPLYERLKEMANLLSDAGSKRRVAEQTGKIELEDEAYDPIDKKVGPLLDTINNHARELLQQPSGMAPRYPDGSRSAAVPRAVTL
jgi:hypothetical protein